MPDDSLEPLVESRNGDADRLAQSVDRESPPRLPFPVVAIGGSAGGLEAFIALFKAMPPDPHMAFVIVQHLPPDRESMIAEILQRHTPMPVRQIEDGMAVKPDHVYIIRPGHTLTLKEGHLHLAENVEKPGHSRPVDDLFKSVAEEQRERAICIIMSGMGSNGTAGTGAIKAVGGLAIAQDPDSAKYPSMPRHLIDANLADLVLRPEEIPAALLRYARHSYASGYSPLTPAAPRTEQSLAEVINILRSRARHDFAGYKKPTILRRIQRRMGLNQTEQLGDYVALLRQNANEISSLADDLMIHVTGFFRDPESWEALREQVLVPLIRAREQEGSVRCWVTACSTGEEAYTLAMLLHETAEAEHKVLDIKVFATDMADRTLAHARAGLYPGGIESEISPERLERFFDREDALYRVKREIRECVVFAAQNVTYDPPFSRLDLCTCRNLLIYLEPELQERVLSLLHFGLVERGVLFLGTSETTSTADELFETVDKRHRIFRRVGPSRQGLLQMALPIGSPTGRGERLSRSVLPKASVALSTHRLLLERHTPAAVTIDRQNRVVYFHGPTEEFLTQPGGEPTRDLFSLLRPQFRGAVRTALQKSQADNEPHAVRDGFLEEAAGRTRLVVTVEPLDDRPPFTHYLISFERRIDAEPNLAELPAEGTGQSLELQAELERVRDELQRTVEELQSSNEELRTASEESMVVNEELQSTNEELETSKEEMQSLNEELVTVNSQLQSKMEELETTGDDLRSLLTSTTLAVVFLDTQFRIRQFTPAVRDLLDLIPADVGRPLRDLARKFTDRELLADCAAVLETLALRESEVVSESGGHYLRRVHPYRTMDNRITGVVISFVDVTSRRQAEELLRLSETRMRLLIDGAQDYAMILLDAEGRITTWNIGAERMLGHAEREVLGRSGEFLLPPESRTEEWEAELEEARIHGKVSEDRQHARKDGSEFWGNGMMQSLCDAAGNVTGFVKILRDDSVRRTQDLAQDESVTREKRGRLDAEWATGLRDKFLAVLSHELRTPLSSIMLWSQMLRQDGLTDEQRQQGLLAIEASGEAQKQLLNELLDSSRIASGKIHLAPRPTDIRALVHATIESIQPNAGEAGITLEADLTTPSEPVVLDPNRIRQVLINLLTNAIKFTDSGGKIVVRLRSTRQEIHFHVEDTGRGIPLEFLPHVFEPFAQQDTEATRTQGGLGLGLAISKQLVELHGGTVRVASAGLGKGAAFHVRLPYTRPTSPSTEVSGGSVLPCRLPAGSRILLIEDDNPTRTALVRLMEKAGAAVTALSSGVNALEAFERVRPHLIVSDIGLPGEDGFVLLRRIRDHEEQRLSPPTPAIALTAFAREDDQLHAVAAGFQQHVAKPVDGTRLLALIATHLPDSPGERGASAP